MILVGGRSDLFNSGGRWSKGGGIFSKFRGELAKRGVKKFRGVWTMDEAMCHMTKFPWEMWFDVCSYRYVYNFMSGPKFNLLMSKSSIYPTFRSTTIVL